MFYTRFVIRPMYHGTTTRPPLVPGSAMSANLAGVAIMRRFESGPSFRTFPATAAC
jgi:hypothetical protein